MKTNLIHILIHFIFESLAYFIGFRLFKKAQKNDYISSNNRTWVSIACIFGAALGAKLLTLFENPYQLNWQGKSIIGALIGGWIAVEIAKKFLNVNRSTGDILVIPLCTGIIIGRLGCFFSGLEDQTFGIDSNLPWAMDFGDGVKRHPTQLYEIIFASLFLVFIKCNKKISKQEGILFKSFMLFYLSFRFFVQFIKPTPHIYYGLDLIQIISLITIIITIFLIFKNQIHEK